MLSQQNSALRFHLGAKTFFPVTFPRFFSHFRAGLFSAYMCSSDVLNIFFFYLKELWSHFFSSTVFLSSTTGEVYICRSVFDNCVVHLGVFFKGNCQIQCKRSDFCFIIFDCFLIFLLQAAFRLCRLWLTFLMSHPHHATLPILLLGHFFFFLCNLLYSISIFYCSVWVSSLPGGFAGKTHLQISFCCLFLFVLIVHFCGSLRLFCKYKKKGSEATVQL